jgi:hypothetical protein
VIGLIGLPHNVVLSEGLSKDALLDGIRSGRNWIAESSAVNVTFSATSGGRTAGISERLSIAELAPVDVTLEITGVPNGVVRLISDEGQVMQASLDASGAGTVTYRTTPSLAAYIRAEVRHVRPDGTPGKGTGMGPDLQLGPMAALTNPIFLGCS